MMEDIEKIKAHYNFSNGDIKNLEGLRPMMEKYRDDFVVQFYDYVKHFERAKNFLKDEATIRRHQDALRAWFMGLFYGDYDTTYFHGLGKVGMAHVKIGLPAHYVNAAFHFVKIYIHEKIIREVGKPEECPHLLNSVDKILDINLDVFTSSYIEEEKKYFLSERVESYLVQFANRFSHGFNLILVIGLVFLGIMVMGLFIYDLTHIFQGDIERGLLSTLGSLLMLWVVIELMDTEIKHLKGGRFAVKVFVSVALVAIIRKILVQSLSTEAVEAQVTLIAAVAVLGFIYWLISKVE